MNKLIKSYWPAIFWSAIIIILLSIPGSGLPDESHFLNVPHSDKYVHFALFGLFVFLWCGVIYLRRQQQRMTIIFFLITVIGILLGYLMELVQKYLVANRDYDMWDVVADAAGAIAGLIFSLIVYRKK